MTASSSEILEIGPRRNADLVNVTVVVQPNNDVRPIEIRKAKDILRAARLPLLPRDNAHVASDLAKIAENQPLSPILLIRGGPIHYELGVNYNNLAALHAAAATCAKPRTSTNERSTSNSTSSSTTTRMWR